jgi:CheY-like chemotaxis protein
VPHKLLLADDSVTIQKVIELTFADEDIEVLAVNNGRQAIEMIPHEKPNIVLADVGMPERDGYEVAAFIKGRPDLSHIPVLLLTGAFEPIDEGRAKAAGCDGVLVKPFEPQMVINRVKDLIAGKRSVHGGAVEPRPSPHVAGPLAPAVPADEYFNRLDSVFPSKEPAAAVPAKPVEGTTAPPASVFSASPPAPALPASAPAPAFAEAPAGKSSASAPALPASAPAPRASAPAPRASAPAPRASAPALPASAPAPPASAPPSLAEAFAALLAAEQGKVPPPLPLNDAALRDDVVEEVTRRVVERMTDKAARDVALDVAERVVREEIERIKSQAR